MPYRKSIKIKVSLIGRDSSRSPLIHHPNCINYGPISYDYFKESYDAFIAWNSPLVPLSYLLQYWKKYIFFSKFYCRHWTDHFLNSDILSRTACWNTLHWVWAWREADISSGIRFAAKPKTGNAKRSSSTLIPFFTVLFLYWGRQRVPTKQKSSHELFNETFHQKLRQPNK